jgi:hypothetical protein
MSMVYTILLGSTASTATLDNSLAQKALDTELVRSNMQRWTKELCAVFGGCTLSIVDGNYIMDSGELCTESTFQFTCYLIGSDADAANIKATWRKVKSIAADMAEVFGQECVLISRAKCKAELVRA